MKLKSAIARSVEILGVSLFALAGALTLISAANSPRALAQIVSPTFDVACPTGTSVLERSQTRNPVNNHLKAYICVDSLGNVTGLASAAVAITTGASATLPAASEYVFNLNPTAAAAVTYTLPPGQQGVQQCAVNGNNGTAADTGALTLQTSGSGQFIDYNGTLSASGGFVSSGGAAGDKACLVGIDSTHWEFYPQVGTWTLH